MDGGAWWAAVHGVAEESDMTERLHFHFPLSCTGEGNSNPLQCSCWRIPGTGEPGGLPSMGSHRVRHDWSDLAAAAALSDHQSSHPNFLPETPLQSNHSRWKFLQSLSSLETLPISLNQASCFMLFLKLKARINLKTSLGKLFLEVYFLKYQPGQVLISIFNKLSRRQHLYKPRRGTA